jgi:HEAT repeat protein
MRVVLALCLVGLLCGCGGNRSTETWITELQSRDATVRLEAVRALAERRSEADVVIPELAKALKDENAAVRRDAAHALGNMGADAKPAVPGLLFLLQDKNIRVRKVAALAIKRIDPDRAAKR